MTNDFYKIGSHNVICDICGKKRKREQVKKTWDGFMACTVEKCWYPKHPNDNPRRIVQDGYPVQDARPRSQMQDLPQIAWPGSQMYHWEDSWITWETGYPVNWDDDLSLWSLDDTIR